MRLAAFFLTLGLFFTSPAAFAGEAEGVYAEPATPLQGAPALDSYAGKESLIILFQPDCPWCILQMREIRSIEAPDINIIAVSLKGSRSELIAELRKGGANIPAYRSSPALLRALGNPEATPRIYHVTKTGEITTVMAGKQDKSVLLALINQVPNL